MEKNNRIRERKKKREDIKKKEKKCDPTFFLGQSRANQGQREKIDRLSYFSKDEKGYFPYIGKYNNKNYIRKKVFETQIRPSLRRMSLCKLLN